jgi:toxin ParE1/3/4
VADHRLSKPADADLDGIADYSLQSFGLDQTRIYRDRLFRAFETLDEFPGIGSHCSFIRKGARRFVHDSHVIYFRRVRSVILILRILGADQDPARNL